MSELLTISEVAEALRCPRRSVYGLVRSGALIALRIGRRLRVDAEDLRTFVRDAKTTQIP